MQKVIFLTFLMCSELDFLKSFPLLCVCCLQCVCVCVCVCGHVYVVYEDTNLYNDMGMT